MEAQSIKLSKADKHNDVSVFCSFHLGKLEVVLAVETIQEVVNYPEAVTKAPMSPNFLEGVFNLRGMIIPIINMHELLETSGSISPQTKIAIVTYQDIKIGLTFDSTSEILKVKQDEVCEFNFKGNHKGVVNGVIKLDEGRKVLQIIDPEKMVGLDNIPHVLTSVRASHQGEASSKNFKRGKKKQCISFCCDGVVMAFEMATMNEILEYRELQASYVNYGYSLGLLNLRGSLIPVINFGSYLNPGSKDKPKVNEDKIALVKFKDRRIGLMVNGIEDIISFHEDEVLPISEAGQDKKGLYQALLKKDDSEVILLNESILSNDPELNDIIDGHAKLFKEAEIFERKKVISKREVYISFKIQGMFSLLIHEIREIIEFPKDFLSPQSSSSHVMGLFNLRDKVITIIDMRRFYGLAPKESNADSKVLIVERANESFGLVVDDVVEIFTVSSEDKYPVPKTIISDSESKLSQDMKELVMVINKRESSANKLIVLNLENILTRIRNE